MVTNQTVVTVGYDIENLTDPERKKKYHGEIVKDHYGRQIPKHAHGTQNLEKPTSSARCTMDAASELFDRITDQTLLVRRLNVTACHVVEEASLPKTGQTYAQNSNDLFWFYCTPQNPEKYKQNEEGDCARII